MVSAIALADVLATVFVWSLGIGMGLAVVGWLLGEIGKAGRELLTIFKNRGAIAFMMLPVGVFLLSYLMDTVGR